MTEIIALQ